jgi:hypothetical protein
MRSKGNRWKVALRGLSAATLMALLSLAGTGAAELDPAAVVFKLPDQIKWNENATAGNANAVLYGDPSKPVSISCWSSGMRAI